MVLSEGGACLSTLFSIGGENFLGKLLSIGGGACLETLFSIGGENFLELLSIGGDTLFSIGGDGFLDTEQFSEGDTALLKLFSIGGENFLVQFSVGDTLVKPFSIGEEKLPIGPLLSIGGDTLFVKLFSIGEKFLEFSPVGGDGFCSLILSNGTGAFLIGTLFRLDCPGNPGTGCFKGV